MFALERCIFVLQKILRAHRMNVFNPLEQYVSSTQSILTIGTFDGVHVGHQKIIRALVEEAHQKGLLANVLTFFPHPRMVLKKESNIKLIDTLEEKEALLRQLGVDNLIIHPFSKAFSQLSALEFTRDILVEKLNIAKLIIGYDHRFGKNREATVEDLIRLGVKFNFEVKVLPPEQVDAITVSSTKIRHTIADGDMEQTQAFLGRPFAITGKVVRGDQIGRTINFPTANLAISDSYKMIPTEGVYIVRSALEGSTCFGMMNIGNRPTVAGTQTTVEVHFFDLDKDLYGATLKVELLKKIRAEKKFDSLASLQKQIAKDQEICLETINENNWH
ncbi:bifunctional riboflavin kinase/FAD synthetase [Flavobacteriaceae bacterium]|nr:bifunctional riboflavin kinase/FAD synthetase [Flavobacteriaceae bacterium]